MKTTNLPDEQLTRPIFQIPLAKVGIKNLQKQITRQKNGSITSLSAVFSAYVDLDSEQKGIHMSRNLEAIMDIVSTLLKDNTANVEDLCALISQRLLQKQDNAIESNVFLKADYFLPSLSPVSSKIGSKHYVLTASAQTTKNGNKKYRTFKTIGIEVTGLTVCPCSQELTRHHVKQQFPELTIEQIDKLPLAAHNQRGKAYVSITIPDQVKTVEINDVIKITEDAMSGKIYDVVKRNDELKIVIDAHSKPTFVEDVVRNIILGLYLKYNNVLPDGTIFSVSQTNYESIHQHEAYAEQTVTLDQLKRWSK